MAIEDINPTLEIDRDPVIGTSGVETPVARIRFRGVEVATIRVEGGFMLADLSDDLDVVFNEDDRTLAAGVDDERWAMGLPEDMSGPTPAEFQEYLSRYRLATGGAILDHIHVAGEEALILVRIALHGMAVGRAQAATLSR